MRLVGDDRLPALQAGSVSSALLASQSVGVKHPIGRAGVESGLLRTADRLGRADEPADGCARGRAAPGHLHGLESGAADAVEAPAQSGLGTDLAADVCGSIDDGVKAFGEELFGHASHVIAQHPGVTGWSRALLARCATPGCRLRVLIRGQKASESAEQYAYSKTYMAKKWLE